MFQNHGFRPNLETLESRLCLSTNPGPWDILIGMLLPVQGQERGIIAIHQGDKGAVVPDVKSEENGLIGMLRKGDEAGLLPAVQFPDAVKVPDDAVKVQNDLIGMLHKVDDAGVLPFPMDENALIGMLRKGDDLVPAV